MMMSNKRASGQAQLEKQRSHVLFVLSRSQMGQEQAFRSWYQNTYRQSIAKIGGVLSVQHYEQHEVDVTRGHFPPLPFPYLGICDISVDGAEAAEGIIERITALHREHAGAEAPATWLYYPVSEKVGRSPASTPSMLILAFANGVRGQEAEFREWYATRHIRHALKIPALVSGQCFERTLFQRPGALEAKFNTIAVYEQEGTPEEFLAGHASVSHDELCFPMLDLDPSRFAEWTYNPL